MLWWNDSSNIDMTVVYFSLALHTSGLVLTIINLKQMAMQWSRKLSRVQLQAILFLDFGLCCAMMTFIFVFPFPPCFPFYHDFDTSDFLCTLYGCGWSWSLGRQLLPVLWITQETFLLSLFFLWTSPFSVMWPILVREGSQPCPWRATVCPSETSSFFRVMILREVSGRKGFGAFTPQIDLLIYYVWTGHAIHEVFQNIEVPERTWAACCCKSWNEDIWISATYRTDQISEDMLVLELPDHLDLCRCKSNFEYHKSGAWQNGFFGWHN